MIVSNEKKTQDIAKKVAKSIDGTSLALCLNGDLGSGKTTFTRHLIRYLQKNKFNNEIPSPTFTLLQIYEYQHASFDFSGHIYGATFYMATGFHGFHVVIGTIFLAVCLWRGKLGHFNKDHHFGFEAAAWYWHFVDVVWLFLFAAIYVWGS